MNLDDIAVPSNFAALQAILRSMMPPECIQRDGHPGRTIALDSPDEYVDITTADDNERDAIRAWWTSFSAYVRERGGHEIVWGVRPEREVSRNFAANKLRYAMYGRLFIAKVPVPEVTW